MKSAVIVFPGINRETDMMRALEATTGTKSVAVWHAETELPPVKELAPGHKIMCHLPDDVLRAMEPVIEFGKKPQGVNA